MIAKKILLGLYLLVMPAFCMANLPAKDKGNKALFTITTFNAADKTLHQGYGFFIDNKGTALASYNIFNGASRAEIKDIKGKKWNVTRIEGVSDIYEVVKFRTDCEKSECYEMAENAATQGESVTVLFNSTPKTNTLSTLPAKISKCDLYNGLTYYTIDAKSDTSTIGTPVINTAGKVIGILQRNAEKNLTKSFAVDISVEKHLATSALSAGQTAINNIYIPKQLPADTTQAASYIYLLAKNSEDTLSYLTALEDFKIAYPQHTLSYVEHARYMAERGLYAEVEKDYNEAFEKVTNKAEAHYNFSRLIYQLNMYNNYKTYNDWDLNKALAEAKQAYELFPTPLYLLQQGNCHFALKQYQEAFDNFQELNKTNFASAQTFFYAARSRELLDDDSTVVLALMDSAMARFSEPYNTEAGPYLLQRAQLRNKYQHFKDAAFDFDAYEKLIGSKRLNDNFFYMKEQNDFNAKFYAWALNDIDKALQIRPQEYLYLVERAVIQLHVGDNDEAIYSAQQALKVNPQGADAYKIIGIAQGQKNNKAEALKNLQKAKELGDPQVDEWIEKLK